MRPRLSRHQFQKAVAVDEEIDALPAWIANAALALVVAGIGFVAYVIVRQQSQPDPQAREVELLRAAAGLGVVCVLSILAFDRVVGRLARWSNTKEVGKRYAQLRRYLDFALASFLAAIGIGLSAEYTGYVLELAVALVPLLVVIFMRGPIDRWTARHLLRRHDRDTERAHRGTPAHPDRPAHPGGGLSAKPRRTSARTY